MAKAARPAKEASGGTAETAISPVRPACWARAGSPCLLRRLGSPPGVVSAASAASAGVPSSGTRVIAAVAAAWNDVAPVRADAGNRLKYLCGTTTTTEVPSQGESAKVTRMP